MVMPSNSHSSLDTGVSQRYNYCVDFSETEIKMKRFLKVFLPILLSVVILLGVAWYFLVYDKMLTQTILMDLSHHFSNKGDYNTAAWLNDLAFNHFGNDDAVPLEQAELYLSRGNYTQAERVLNRGIENGGGAELYIMLCKVYVEQDKLLDAAELLDNVSDHSIKAELDAIRPAAPSASLPAGKYHEYANITFSSNGSAIYIKEGIEYPSTATDLQIGSITLHGGENNFACIAVGANGLVSSLANYSYIVGGVIEEVHFSDTAMETEIRKLLNLPSGTAVFTDDIWTIHSFTVPKEAKDYSELKHMPYLEELIIESGASGQLKHLQDMPDLKTLTVTNTPVSSEELSIIAQLPKLEKLTLNSCSLTTLAPLAALKGLIYLDVGGNTIRNLEPIASMKKLETLNLQRNAVNDLSAISGNQSLLNLDVSYNSISDISVIFNLSKLQSLNAKYNSLSNLSGISKLSKLSYLDVSNNLLSDVSALADCTQLANLNIASNSISDIQSLSTLVNMTDFVFSYNKVTKLPSWPKSCQLQNISGDHNDIRSLSPLAGLMRLNCVYMDYNTNLSDVNVLKDCQVLFRVDVFGTKVKDISALKELSITVNYNPVA